jgi:hypothetical protein
MQTRGYFLPFVCGCAMLKFTENIWWRVLSRDSVQNGEVAGGRKPMQEWGTLMCGIEIAMTVDREMRRFG